MNTKNEVFATNSRNLKQHWTESLSVGLRKNLLVEEAIKEKIEDLLDAYDLRQAIKESTGFSYWESVKKAKKSPR